MTRSAATPPRSDQPRDDSRELPVPDDPRLLRFLPLIYVAWADGVLSDRELSFLRERLDTVDGADAEGRHLLDAWLDPDAPPSPGSLQALRRTLRRRAESLDAGQRQSLARMGQELARRESGPAGPDDDEDVALIALEEIEEMLGVQGEEAVRELLQADPSPAERDAEKPVLAPLPTADPSFSVDALRSLMASPYAETRERVLELLAEPEFAIDYGRTMEERRERVWQWTGRLAAEGYGIVGYPEACGGSGEMGRAIAVFETLAFHDLSLVVKYGVQFGLFGGSILQLGTRKHHEAYLERVGRAELAGCFAMTETGHGSNVRDIRTTAVFDPDTDEFVIDTPGRRARKDYIGNAALHGRLATVFAQLQVGEDHHGVHAFLVPIRDDDGDPMPNVSIEDCGHKEGLEGVDNGRLTFDQVRIPRHNLLDRFGAVDEDGHYTSPIPSQSRRFYTMLGTLVTGRISIAAASVSTAKTAVAIAVRYGARRRQFGPAGGDEVSILDYRVHQRRLLPRLAATYALHFASRELVARYLEETDDAGRRAVEALAGGLKAYASDHAVDSLQVCRELCGGQGYLAENRFGRLKADVDVFTTFEGANPVLLQLVAKGLLTGLKEEFAEMKAWGVMANVAGRAISDMLETNPISARRAREEHLRGDDFQASALAYREDRLLRTAAARMRSRLRNGEDSFEVMNDVQDHLQALARAHVERVIHDAFDRAVEAQPDGEEKAALDRLRDLWVLWRIEEDRGWFLESGYMSASKSKAVRQQVNELCAEVRRDALGLVDALGIPDAILAAPIALP